MLKNFKAEVAEMSDTSDGYVFCLNLAFIVPGKLKKKAMQFQREVGGRYSRHGFGVYVLLDDEGFEICPLSYYDECDDNELGYRFTSEEKKKITDACAAEMLAKINRLEGKE